MKRGLAAFKTTTESAVIIYWVIRNLFTTRLPGEIRKPFHRGFARDTEDAENLFYR